MKHLYFILILSLIISCQESQNIPTNFEDIASSTAALSKFSTSNDLTINEPGYNLYLIAENLITPEGVAFYPREKSLMIGQSIIGNVMKLDHSGNLDEFVNLNLQEPPGIAVIDLLADYSRGLFITVLRHRQVFLVEKSGNISEFASDLNYPLFMELDFKHNLYVSELFGNCITLIDQSGSKEKFIDFNPIDNWGPRGIVFNHKKQLYVLSGNENEIWMFDLKNIKQLPLSLNDGDLVATLENAVFPQDITIGFNNNLFVVDWDNIWKVDTEGNVTLFANGLVGRYNTIHSTTAGELMVTDYGSGKLYGISKTKFKIN